jgi:RNA polymerase sigma-70 factor (ECF subfamily)
VVETDTELVIHARNGDQAAFATLADSLYGRLHQVAYRLLRDRRLAEDATQQAVLMIWRDLPQLRDPDRFEAWSYRLLVNACNSEFRRRKRTLPSVGDAASREPSPLMTSVASTTATRSSVVSLSCR